LSGCKKPATFGTLGGNESQARAINDANQILFAEYHRRWLEPITVGRLFPSPTEYWIWDPNYGRVPLNPQALTRRG
jgi:hypothetical protein